MQQGTPREDSSPLPKTILTKTILTKMILTRTIEVACIVGCRY